MVSSRLAAVLLVLLLVPLAGCLDGRLFSDGLDPDAILPPGQAAKVVPEDRPVVDVVRWHEDREGEDPYGNLTLFGSPIVMENEWEPRDVNLTFHGIHETWDEWGRSVPAYIYHYVSQVLHIECEGPFEAIQCTGRWQDAPREFQFDRSDGRFLGLVDFNSHSRVFRDPDFRDPIAYYDALMFLFMAVHVLDGDLSGPIPVDGGRIVFDPYVRTPPLEGECDPYEVTYEPNEPEPIAMVPAPQENYRSLICLEEGGVVPLWIWAGTEGDSHWWMRESGGLRMPPLKGTPLAPDTFPTLAWQAVEGFDEVPADLPLDQVLPPVLAPPTSGTSDWATAIQGRLAALMRNPDFIKYQVQHDTMYTPYAVTGFPVFEASSILDLVLGEDNPVEPSYDEESWLWTSDGDGFYWGFVETRYGGPEDPPEHASTRSGSDFDFSGWKYRDVDALPDIPDFAALSERYTSIAPVAPDLIMFDDYPADFAEFVPEEYMLRWYGVEDCFEAPGTELPLYAFMSGFSGQLFQAGHAWTDDSGCTAGAPFPVELAFGRLAHIHPGEDGGSSTLSLPDGRVLVSPHSSLSSWTMTMGDASAIASRSG